MPSISKTHPSRVAEVRANAPPADDATEKLLSKSEVIDRTGRSFPTLWAWMRSGRFPRARDACGRPAWLQSEIDAWMKSLPLRRFKGDR